MSNASTRFLNSKASMSPAQMVDLEALNFSEDERGGLRLNRSALADNKYSRDKSVSISPDKTIEKD